MCLQSQPSTSPYLKWPTLILPINVCFLKSSSWNPWKCLGRAVLSPWSKAGLSGEVSIPRRRRFRWVSLSDTSNKNQIPRCIHSRIKHFFLGLTVTMLHVLPFFSYLIWLIFCWIIQANDLRGTWMAFLDLFWRQRAATELCDVQNEVVSFFDNR